jgi:hypothetical protein
VQPCQGMRSRHHKDPLITQEGDHLQSDVGTCACRLRGPGPEGYVVGAVTEQRRDVCGGFDDDIDGGSGDAFGEEVKQPSGRMFSEGGCCDDPQQPGVGGCVGDFPPGLVGQTHDFLGIVRQRPASGRQGNASRSPDEEGVAEVPPERSQGRGDGRLADGQGRGGSVERPQSGHERKGPQLAQSHRHSFITLRL